MPSVVSHSYHPYPIIICNSRSYTLLYIYFPSSTEANITFPVMVIFGQNERESIINYLSLKKYKLLMNPENKNDRQWPWPVIKPSFPKSKKPLFYDGQNEASIKTKPGRLLRLKPDVYKGLKLSSFKRLKAHPPLITDSLTHKTPKKPFKTVLFMPKCQKTIYRHTIRSIGKRKLNNNS